MDFYYTIMYIIAYIQILILFNYFGCDAVIFLEKNDEKSIIVGFGDGFC